LCTEMAQSRLQRSLPAQLALGRLRPADAVADETAQLMGEAAPEAALVRLRRES